MSCQRNRTSVVSFEFRVTLIWRVLLIWLWRKNRISGFQSPWTSHLGLSYHFLVSFVHVVPHRFYLLLSYFFLRLLPKWHILSLYFSLSLTFVLIIDLAWHISFPWTSSFFILLEINVHSCCFGGGTVTAEKGWRGRGSLYFWETVMVNPWSVWVIGVNGGILCCLLMVFPRTRNVFLLIDNNKKTGRTPKENKKIYLWTTDEW